MGKLLRALKLEDPLPDDLANSAKTIGDVEKNLSKTRAKPLKLKESASQVAENLNDLNGKVEPALLAAKKAELESLARRIADRGPDDAGLTTDAMELQMLLAETECVLKDNKKNREALQKARANYGDALVARVDTGGDLAKDLKTYIDGQITNDNTNRVTAALKALDELRNSKDPRVSKAAVDVANQFARETQAKLRAVAPTKGEQRKETEKSNVSRTPNDVLVHVSTVVNNALNAHKDDPTLKAIATDARKLFMNHTLDTTSVAALVDRAEKALTTLNEGGAVALCGKLKKQLPESDDKLQATQLHDNLYGRVFDTKMVSTLVKNPPAELLTASGKSGAAFAGMLADTPENEEAAKYFVEHYIVEDKRPWSASVPGFATLANAKDGKAALAALKSFLTTAPTTGQEVIAFSYIMAKMPQAQKQTGHEPVWLLNASGNYSRITSQANRDRGAGQEKVLSKAAGITMRHQPDASDDANLVETERPGSANIMGNRKNLKDDQELSDVKRSKQNEIQLKQALPFASGVSGTTNILLHLYEEMETKGATGVTPQEFLMNSMMFLVYDGGHSMHEAMWTANQIEADLKSITFGLNDPSLPKNEPNQFVSDYDRLMGQFKEPLKTSMEQAQENAWKGTQEYMQKNSIFAE
jgi:hypothetical protein